MRSFEDFGGKCLSDSNVEDDLGDAEVDNKACSIYEGRD
jgi:hypothetical protein